MELKTGKIRPVGVENEKEIVDKICTQFALLIDEVGHRLSVMSSENQKLKEQVEELSQRISALEAV